MHDILDNEEDRVVVLVTENAERNGARLAHSAVRVWRFQDGKATSFQAFLPTSTIGTSSGRKSS